MRHIVLCAVTSVGVITGLASAEGQSAQGLSPVDIVSIMTSPTSFQAGTQVTFSVEVKNTGNQKSKNGTIYLDIFRGDQFKPGDLLWGATQDVGRIEPGASEHVEFAARNELRGAFRMQTWTVPADGSDVFSIRVSVVDASSTTARVKAARFVRKCTYSKPAPIAALPGVSATELRGLKRPGP